MSVRSFIQGNPAVVAAIAIVVMAATWFVILRNTAGSGGDAQPATYTYFDITNGELYTSAYQDPPATGPSGPGTGVLAHMFTCGSCESEADRFVGYVTKYAGMPTPAVQGGDLIARAERPLKWHPVNSDEAEAIKASINQKCDAPKACQ